MSSVPLAVTEEYRTLTDPTFTYQATAAHFTRLQLVFVSLLGCYVAYLVYLAMRAFGELRSMSFIDARLRFHAFSLAVALALAFFVTLNRYGRALWDDNLLARVYSSYESEYHFLAFYTVANCYVYVLAYVYAPPGGAGVSSAVAASGGSRGGRGGTREHHVLKDNPSFSMVNESDDEDSDGGEETDAMLGPKKRDGGDGAAVGNGAGGGVGGNTLANTHYRPPVLGHDDSD